MTGAAPVQLGIVGTTMVRAVYNTQVLSSPSFVRSSTCLVPCVAGVGPIADDPEKVVRINFLGTRCLTEALLPRIRIGGGVTLVASSAGRDWTDNRQLVDELVSTTAFVEGLDWLSKHRATWSAQAYKFSKQCETPLHLS